MKKKGAHKKIKTSKKTSQRKELNNNQAEIKQVKKKEKRQLLWFFFWIAVAFAAFLIPYFISQSAKTFEYSSISWAIEDYEHLRVYHGRFPSLSIEALHYNIYLRHDPRQNNVETLGDFSSFKFGGLISISPEVDLCRGELSRALVDLGAFMKKGIGVQEIDVGTTDEDTSVETGKKYVDCSTNPDRTVLIITLGDSFVEQSNENEFCYIISIEDCKDIQPLEKFMVKAVHDFKGRY